ncbi:MAG: biopolymer transporter ExbD [Saprospiraceae bacterium]|nr:biopolymer transporter ExbD [Saprospiraceae bacterium]
MALQRRNRVSAEFSMSSLTDIIFLLLIFFMLTANFIQIHNIELPESDSKTIASTSITVTIDRAGQYFLNGAEISAASLEGSVSAAVAESENKSNATVTIVAETGVPFERVSRIMGIASRLKVKAILATQPRG